MQKVGILFDLDGTLLDTLQDLTESVNCILGHYGLPRRSEQEVRRFVGNGAGMLIKRALPGWENQPTWQEALEFFEDHYRKNCQGKTKPYDGICEALDVIGRKYPVAIVSNKPDSAVKAQCQQYFPGSYAQGEAPGCLRKPAPDMVYRAMEAIGVSRCIYVGDSEVDVQTAQNAGVPCLSVLWGFRDREELEAAGAARFCETPEEMLEELEKLIHGQ